MNLSSLNLESILKAVGAAFLVAVGLGHALTQHLGVTSATTNDNIALGLGIYLAAPIIASIVKPKTTSP